MKYYKAIGVLFLPIALIFLGGMKYKNAYSKEIIENITIKMESD